MTWWTSVDLCKAMKDEDIFTVPIEDIFQAGSLDGFSAGSRDVFQACTLVEDPENINTCLKRVKVLEKRLNEIVVGQDEAIRLMIASAIAQKPFLLIGPPGLAKTLMAVKFFELLGLRRPDKETRKIENDDEVEGEGESQPEELNAYFEYLLHSFSIPEEIYGPYNVQAMRGEDGHPRMIRINDNMLTGKGVRACFLDEVFKANSAILNTLLTLINERRYFNDSVFNKSDLRVIIGASNETPTKREQGDTVVLPELRAFYDRWIIRCHVQSPVSYVGKGTPESLYASIREAAILQQGHSLHHGESQSEEQIATINDFTALGRCLITRDSEDSAFMDANFNVALPDEAFVECLVSVGIGLDGDEKHHLCTMNPRKLVAVEMITRAYALLEGGPETELSKEHLGAVLGHIWDDPEKESDLRKRVNSLLDLYKENL